MESKHRLTANRGATLTRRPVGRSVLRPFGGRPTQEARRLADEAGAGGTEGLAHPVVALDQVKPKLQELKLPQPGDRIAQPRPRLFDVEKHAQIPVSAQLIPNPWSIDDFHWAPDSSRFFFEYNERGHQLVRIVAVEAASGEARAIVEEKSATFIDYSQKSFLHWLDAAGELVWASERDGWNHLYLIDGAPASEDADNARAWVVRAVRTHRPEPRGLAASQSVRAAKTRSLPPRRVNPMARLPGATEATARTAFMVPDRRFHDTWSRVDHRRLSSAQRRRGQLVFELERADVTAPPTPAFAARAFSPRTRRARSPRHHLPRKCDPAQNIRSSTYYAGPQYFFVPSVEPLRASRLRRRGFVVVQIDGMGTNWRSRAFHDVAFKNLKDAGFPDRIAWITAAAATRPWMDLTRIGIFGGSAGGQNALGALLFHGDFYKAAVADCGCHDNRMDKIWWNELWMGWPVGPDRGQLEVTTLRIHRQTSVTSPNRQKRRSASTMRSNALIKADKDFDLIVMTGAGHGSGSSPYGRRRRDDFFIRHLQGREPRAQP